jgi:hypothetical protein
MRLVLAGLVDTCILFVLQHPQGAEFVISRAWKLYSSAIWADQVEYRRRLGHSYPLMGSAVASREAMLELMGCDSPEKKESCKGSGEARRHSTVDQMARSEVRRKGKGGGQ